MPTVPSVLGVGNAAANKTHKDPSSHSSYLHASEGKEKKTE